MQIEQTRLRKLPYVHLGGGIAGSKKMDSKAEFDPHEVLVGGTWQAGSGSA